MNKKETFYLLSHTRATYVEVPLHSTDYAVLSENLRRMSTDVALVDNYILKWCFATYAKEVTNE